MYRYKFKLFSISLLAIWLVLFIKNVDIPIYWGVHSQFVGWVLLLTYRNVIAFLSLIMFFIAIYNLIQLKHRLKGSPGCLTMTLVKIHYRSYDYVNTLATIVTLFSVILIPIESLRDFIVFLLMMSIICICFLKTNLYYSNPIFAALGYRLYKVEVNNNKFPKEFIGIYYGNLSIDKKVFSYHVSDDVYYLI